MMRLGSLSVFFQIVIVGSLSATSPLLGQAPMQRDQSLVCSELGIETFPLWNGSMPGEVDPAESLPSLTAFVSQHGKANGTAVVIAPGGGYLGLASNLEGRQVADWFTARGITAFVLNYRLGYKNRYSIPLLDAQRAIRLARSLNKKYGLSTERIGMVEFSAGGRLAASTGTSLATRCRIPATLSML